MSLSHVRIGAKIAAIAIVLSLIGLGGSTFLAKAMFDVDARYSDLLDNYSFGSMWLARAATRVSEMNLYSYQILAHPGSGADGKAAAAGYQASLALAFKDFDEAEKLLPQVSEIVPLRRQAETIDRIGRQAIAAGLRSDDAVVKDALARMDPLVQAFGAQVKEVVDRVRDATQVESDRTSERVGRIYYVTIMTATAVAVVAVLVSLLVSAKGITGPLVQLQGRMRELADGRLDVDVEGQDRRDEIGGMARAVQVFKDNAVRAGVVEREAVRISQDAAEERTRNETARNRIAQEQAEVVASLAQGLTRLSGGDLTYRLSEAFGEEYERLRADFNAAISQLQDTMKVVADNTAGIHSGSGEISQAADDLSRRTEQQAASLEKTAAALDEITATVRKTAAGADHARSAVESAKTDVDRSGEVVRQAVSAMSEIERSSRQIGQIIGVIDEIAFQTNLLALNAGVEAARAGEAGRGFAVVASEVRALAQRSANAAKEIKGLISASGQHVATGVDLVGQTGEALSRIAVQVADINAIVAEIAASAREQAIGLDEVNLAVNQMDQVTQHNAAMVEESTAASHSLVHDAGELSHVVGRFQIGTATAHAPARTRGPDATTRPHPAPKSGVSSPGQIGSLALKASPPDTATESWDEF